MSLEIVTGQLLKEAEKIVTERAKYVRKIETVLNKVMSQLTRTPMVVALRYLPSLRPGHDFQENARKQFVAISAKERILQTTTLGPHRDDLAAVLQGKDVKDHASQGQKRLIVIALKIAPTLWRRMLTRNRSLSLMTSYPS